MDKKKIITQITLLRQSAKQMEDHAQRIITYCNAVEHFASLDEVKWQDIALPIVAEDTCIYAQVCVKRAVRLDTLLVLASEADDRELDQKPNPGYCKHEYTNVNGHGYKQCINCEEELEKA